MKLTFRFSLLALLLFLSACTSNVPGPSNGSNESSLKLRDYYAEKFGNLGKVNSDRGTSIDIPFWMREGLSIIVANTNWPGRKEIGPGFILLARHPLPTTLEEASLHQANTNKIDSKEFPEHLMNLQGTLTNCQTKIGYQFKVDKKNLREDFSLEVGKQTTKYDLSQGRLFLVDLAANPPVIEQVNTNLKQIDANKDDCVKLLRDLAPKSKVAKSILEEAERR